MEKTQINMKHFWLGLLSFALLLSACGPEPTPTLPIYPPPVEPTTPAETVYPPPPQAPTPDPEDTAYPPPQATLPPPSPEAPSGGVQETAYPPPQDTPTPAPTQPPAGGDTPTLAPTQPPAGEDTPYPPPAGDQTPAPTQYPGPQETLPPAQTQALTASPGFRPTLPISGTLDLTPTERPISTAMPPPGTFAQTLRIWHSWSEAEAHILEIVLQNFQDFYPDIAVDVLWIPPDELYSRYEMAAYRGSGPDLLLGPAEWGPLLFEKGLIADLSQDADLEFLKEINPAALGGGRYRAALIGLPHRIRDGVLLYRNTSLLPDRPATYDALVAMARQATRGGRVGAYLERSFLYSAAHLYGLGGRLMDEQGQPAFNTSQGLAWLELLASFEDAGAPDFNSNRDLELFKEGRAGLIIAGSWNWEELAEAIGEENLAIDPWPAVPGGRLTGFVRVDNVFLNANTSGDKRYAALLFMGFMMAREVQSILARAGHIPSVLKVTVPDAFMSQAMRAFEGGTPYPIDPVLDDYWDPLEAALRSVFEAGADPQAALQKAQEEIEGKLK